MSEATGPASVINDDVINDDASATVKPLQLDVFPFVGGCVVLAKGELDRAGRDELVHLSTAGDHRDVFIDISAVTFMDCGGYGSLVAARRQLESEGRKLTVLNFRGQPERLLATLKRLGLHGDRHN